MFGYDKYIRFMYTSLYLYVWRRKGAPVFLQAKPFFHKQTWRPLHASYLLSVRKPVQSAPSFVKHLLEQWILAVLSVGMQGQSSGMVTAVIVQDLKSLKKIYIYNIGYVTEESWNEATHGKYSCNILRIYNLYTASMYVTYTSF